MTLSVFLALFIILIEGTHYRKRFRFLSCGLPFELSYYKSLHNGLRTRGKVPFEVPSGLNFVEISVCRQCFVP